MNSNLSNRLWRSQRGNALMYLLLFGVAWFLFFGIKSWIKDTKDARYNKPQEERVYGDPYLDNAARSED